MFFTRLILIVLAFWLLRQIFRFWSRLRQPADKDLNQAESADMGPSPFDDKDIREADFEDLENRRDAEGDSR